MEDMNDILNPPEIKDEPLPEKAAAQPAGDEEHSETETGGSEAAEVREEPVSEDDKAQLKAERAALAKERERVRQKDAALDEALARVSGGQKEETHQETKETAPEVASDLKTKLKELRRQRQDASADLILDRDDEEAAKRLDEIEEQMDEVRFAILKEEREAEKAAIAANEAAATFNEVHQQVHSDFPFLKPEHPLSNAELNDNIIAYMKGKEAQGVPSAVALKKAVDLFAPAYAKSIGFGEQEEETGDDPGKKEVDRRIMEKLAKGGFSEVRSVGSRQKKGFSGPTPMAAILGSKPG